MDPTGRINTGLAERRTLTRRSSDRGGLPTAYVTSKREGVFSRWERNVLPYLIDQVETTGPERRELIS